MSSKGITTHLNTAVHKTYMEYVMRVNAGNVISVTTEVRQGYPLSPVLFNLYVDEVIRIWMG
jgi:hypothetical protein